MIDFSFIKNILLPPLLNGTIATIMLSVLCIPASLIIGILIAVGKVYGNKIISFLCSVYTIYFRGSPLMVLLLIIYVGLPDWGITLSAFNVVVIGISLSSGAYHSEYIRGALQSVKIGQVMAAKALGMTRIQVILYILLPQALRRAIPPCSNEVIYLIKSTSLAMMVSYVELTGAGKYIASVYFKYTEVFLVVGMIYLLLVSVATKLINTLENKLKIPGF